MRRGRMMLKREASAHTQKDSERTAFRVEDSYHVVANEVFMNTIFLIDYLLGHLNGSFYTASQQESFHRHTATSSVDGSEVDCEGERELFDFCAVPFGEMAFRAWILVMAPQQKKKTNGSFRHVLLHQDLTWRSGGRVSQCRRHHHHHSSEIPCLTANLWRPLH